MTGPTREEVVPVVHFSSSMDNKIDSAVLKLLLPAPCIRLAKFRLTSSKCFPHLQATNMIKIRECKQSNYIQITILMQENMEVIMEDILRSLQYR